MHKTIDICFQTELSTPENYWKPYRQNLCRLYQLKLLYYNQRKCLTNPGISEKNKDQRSPAVKNVIDAVYGTAIEFFLLPYTEWYTMIGRLPFLTL